MPTRTDEVISRVSFLADSASADRNNGKQIDWANVSNTNSAGVKEVPAGTIMCALASGLWCPVADAPGVETATGIIETTATQDSKTDAISGYGMIVGGVVYQNLLPDFADGSFATWQGELNAAGVGHFVWLTFADDRAS